MFMNQDRLLATIQGVAITLCGDGVVRFIANADIDSDGGPNIDHDPCWQPDTTLRHAGASINAQQVPYVVIPIGILNMVGPIGLGCLVTCTHILTGKAGSGVLADLGPRSKVGEISPAMARLLGIDPNSRTGGESRNVIRYELHIGVPAVIDGVTYALQKLHS